ncbi:MAG: N4-gp56 family major capsid protein [Clostridia bacterium]|nr:N4-gp56 family major capsid protein [Clostridia bacterium]
MKKIFLMSAIIRMNLQLFAEPNPNVQATTSEGLSAENKTFYDKRLLQTAQPNLVHLQFGRKTSIPKNGGKTIEYRMYSSFPKALTPLTEGVTPDGVPMQVAVITKTLEEFGAYTTLTDVLDLTAIDNNILQATEKHGDSMALTLDTIVRNELNTTPNVVYASKDGVQATLRSELTAEHKITYADVAKMATFLKRNNTPTIDGSYIMIIHPDVALDIMTDEKWIDVQKYKNPEKIYDGEIGKLHKFRFIESTEAAVYTGDEGGAGGLAIYSCICLGKEAYDVIDVEGAGAEIIVKPAGSSGTADPINQRSTVGWKIPMFGAKITIPQYIFSFMCASSLSASARAN